MAEIDILKEINLELVEKCNLQVEALHSRDLIIEQLAQEVDFYKSINDSSETVEYTQVTKELNYFSRICLLVKLFIENKSFLTPKKNTQNSQMYEQLEQDVFYECLEEIVNQEEQKEFIDFAKMLDLLKTGNNGSIVFTATVNSAACKVVYLKKDFVNFVRGDGLAC